MENREAYMRRKMREGSYSCALVVVLTTVMTLMSQVARADVNRIDTTMFREVRIEQEDKIFVPLEIADEVWRYISISYLGDSSKARDLDSLFTTYHNDEQFADTYYDTPDLKLLAMQSGVRHRRRMNLTNPSDPKSGRELMQVKLNHISDNPLERGELKYDIDTAKINTDPTLNLSMVDKVKYGVRQQFIEDLRKLGLDPSTMRPVLTVHDLRRRVYFLREGIPFMSISYDYASASVWWARTEFVEIEPELSEEEFTIADPETKRYMEIKLREVISDLKRRFPVLETNLDPKYNKSFADIQSQLPFARFLVQTGMVSDEYFWTIIILLVLASGCGGYVLVARLRSGK